MLKQTKKQLARWEKQYHGITEQIMRFENAALPPCPKCCSNNTANVQVGFIGRTMKIAAATTKVRFIANGPKPGNYVCNDCNAFFHQETASDEEHKPQVAGGFTLSCPEDKGLDAFKRWINEMVTALGGDESDDLTEADWKENWIKFWSAAES